MVSADRLKRDDEGAPVDTMMKMRNVLKGKALTEEAKDEITKQAAHLRLSRSWTVNFNTMSRVFQLLSSTDDLPDDLPIHPLALFSRDRDFLVLSCFGRLAPSCNFPAAPFHNLTKGGERPTWFMWEQVPLDKAVADLKMVREKKGVTIPKGTRRSGSYKCVTFKGNECKGLLASVTAFVGGLEVIEGASGQSGVVVNDVGNLFDL
jgi:hypothetical protein